MIRVWRTTTPRRPRKVPGFADLHRMAMLLAERAPDTAKILALGAGGGLKLKALAQAGEAGRFVGVDPSRPMLEAARRLLGACQDRVDLVQGKVDDAPAGPFHGATCLLVLHFLERPERLEVLRRLKSRLRPGARLVVAHHSASPGNDLQAWLALSAALADHSGAGPAGVSASAALMASACRS